MIVATKSAPPSAYREGRNLRMSTARRILLFFLLVIVLGGVIFLATWDRPPPIQQIEVEIPDAQLPR